MTLISSSHRNCHTVPTSGGLEDAHEVRSLDEPLPYDGDMDLSSKASSATREAYAEIVYPGHHNVFGSSMATG